MQKHSNISNCVLCVHHSRPELASVVGLKGCVKGFQFQKKYFNLLEQPGTIGISSGCPEEFFVSAASDIYRSICPLNKSLFPLGASDDMNVD